MAEQPTGKLTLVLLHGVGLDHTVWQPLISLLPDRFEVITPDLPGHGRRPPAPAGVTLGDLAEGIAAEIPVGSHLVGFSLGALVSQHLAVHRPELVASLVSVASVYDRTPEQRAAVLARLETAAVDVAASSAASLRRWYDGTDVEPDLIRATAATLAANDPASFVNCYRVFATADAEIAPLLGRIEVPALAITGADDPGSTPAMTRGLAAAMPNCDAVVIPGARHMLPVQCPGQLVGALTTFYEQFTGGHTHV